VEILLQVLEKWCQGHFEQLPHQQVWGLVKLFFNGINFFFNIGIFLQEFLLIWKQIKGFDLTLLLFKISLLISFLCYFD
jgi:hypothetical protein